MVSLIKLIALNTLMQLTYMQPHYLARVTHQSMRYIEDVHANSSTGKNDFSHLQML